METQVSLYLRGDPATMFDLALRVEDWPRLLPHYRWVRVLADRGDCRVVEMAARRDAIPVRWTAEQRVFPSERRITFRHIGGLTRGMDVVWLFRPQPDGGVLVWVWHRFCPGWPLVPDWLIHFVVGRLFVDNIVRKTLGRIRQLSEQAVVARR